MSRQAIITRTVDSLIAQGMTAGEAIALAVSAPAAPAPARWVTLPDGRIAKAPRA
jgi:hypothetical protein